LPKTRTSIFGVVAHLRSLPGKVDELRKRLLDLACLTQRENGCISCEMIENKSDGNEFTLLEKWSNKEAHKTHFTTNLIQNSLQSLANLLSNDLEFREHISRLNTVRYGTNSYYLEVF
jgi:quinol monooxygenase YgiN